MKKILLPLFASLLMIYSSQGQQATPSPNNPAASDSNEELPQVSKTCAEPCSGTRKLGRNLIRKPQIAADTASQIENELAH
jgi:hypothetical protein